MDVFADFTQRGECVRIEHFVTEAAVEPFNVAVLHRTPRMDVVQSDFVSFARADQFGGDGFRAIVHPDLPGQRVAFLKLFEQADADFQMLRDTGQRHSYLYELFGGGRSRFNLKE